MIGALVCPLFLALTHPFAEPGAFGDDEPAMMKNRLTHMAQREEELLRHVSWLEQRLREAGGDPGAYASEAFARQNEIIDDLKVIFFFGGAGVRLCRVREIWDGASAACVG